MDYWIRLALRPLRHFADFSGRSTRSEVVAFYVLMSVVTLASNLLVGMIAQPFDFRVKWIAQDIVQLAFLCPILALSVRRFHDQGKSGWWLLLVVPALGANAWQFHRSGFSFDPIAQLEHQPPWPVVTAAMFCLLIYLALLIWKDDEEMNRYGPNPRYDEPADPETRPITDAQLP